MQTYAIANCDELPPETFYRRITSLVGERIGWVQLRARALDDRDLLAVAERMRAIIPRTSRFVVNSRADIATAVHADGVHLPAAGLPAETIRLLQKDLLVGRSCHTIEECKRAAAESVDSILLGPVFAPRSKEGKPGVSLKDLEEAGRLGIPVFALGGISRQNMVQFRGLPITGLAAVTLFMNDEPVREIVREVHAL